MERDLTALLDAIVWSRRIVEVDDTTYVFRPLTLEERNIANYIYEKAEKTSKQRKMLTKDELTKHAIKNGLWKSAYQNDIEILKNELGIRREELIKEELENKKRLTPSGKLKNLRNRVSYITDKISELESTYARQIELPSVEYHAEYERGIYSLHCATQFFPSMKQKWPTYESLQNENNTVLVMKLLRMFYDVHITDESEIRQLARSSTWRSKWMGSKKNRGVKTLFDREMYDLTLDQFRLVYWSQIYDSAFESMESPSDEIVENDQLFDEWLTAQAEKRKQERKKSEFENRLKSSNKSKDGSEVGFSVQGYYSEICNCGVKSMMKRRGHQHAPSCPYGVYVYHGEEKRMRKVEEVQATNSNQVRQILATEQKKLHDKGGDLVPEQELRNNMQTRAALGLSTKIIGDNDKPGRMKR